MLLIPVAFQSVAARGLRANAKCAAANEGALMRLIWRSYISLFYCFSGCVAAFALGDSIPGEEAFASFDPFFFEAETSMGQNRK